MTNFNDVHVALSEVEQATNAMLGDKDKQIADLKKQIDELKNPPKPTPKGRFPADPGEGNMFVGMAASGNPLAITAFEQKAGKPVTFRQYDNNGIVDYSVPTGLFASWTSRDVKAGRIPGISGKLGVENLAAHKFEKELVAYFLFKLRLRKRTIDFFHHEPENDWGADQGNAAKMAKHAADFVEAQVWVRSCLNKAIEQFGEENTTVMFAGSLMTYSWTSQGKSKFGDPNLFIPQKGVWDFCGLDHYVEKVTDAMLSAKLTDAVKSLEDKGVIPGIAELGVRPEDTTGGTKIKQAFEYMAAHKAALFLYYNSKVNSTGTGWELNTNNGSEQAMISCLQDARCAN